MDRPERGDSYYQKAMNYNAQLGSGKKVTLVKDVSETDQFGRLLRYVYLPVGIMVNAELVRQGYALASTYPPDVAHSGTLAALQSEAQGAGRGLWGVPAEEPPPSEPTQPSEPPLAASQVMIVHVDKRAEFVDLSNTSGQPQDLSG